MAEAAFGKYRVVEKIGAGGFGEVFRGLDPFLNRPVAIKTCSSGEEELRRRFFREAEIAANLQHPNVVTIFDFGYQDETPYLVQEFLTGEDLDHKIRRREPADLATKLDVLVQIARGLEYAHSRDVVHRDVKPANVRVLDDGQVRIMDFGIAKLLTAETQLTRTGMALGTAAYLPPEQIMGREVDPRADLFSYGVVAYELLTWKRPFAGGSLSAMLYAIAHKEPQPLAGCPGCPPRLAAVIETCLAKDPDDRYPGFAEVIAELEALSAMPAIPPVPPLPPQSAAAGPEAPPPSPPPPPGLASPPPGEQQPTEQMTIVTRTPAAQAARLKGRAVTRLLIAGAAVVMLAVAGLGGWWLLRQAGEARPDGTPPPSPAALAPRQESGVEPEPGPTAERAEPPVPEDVRAPGRQAPSPAAEVDRATAHRPPPSPTPPVSPPSAAVRQPSEPRGRQAAPGPAPLIVATPHGMEMGRLGDGQRAYTDRDFTYRDVPWTYRDLPCLRTPNDLKRADASLSLTLGRGAEVFVAHDLRIKDKPEWLASFEDTGLAVRVGGDDVDENVKLYQVFVKQFPPGVVALGPNLPTSSERERASMYTVFFRQR